MELGDKTPSAFLREMRTLAESNVTDDLLKTLWIQRLPQRIQELLMVLENVDLDKLAACANKTLERTAGFQTAVITHTAQDHVNRMTEQLEKLTVQVSALQSRLD